VGERFADMIDILNSLVQQYGHLNDKLSEKLRLWAINWQNIKPNYDMHQDIDYTDTDIANATMERLDFD